MLKIIIQKNPHCVLLGSNYTVKKLVFFELPIISIYPTHLEVTMAKYHGVLPIGLKGEQKNFFSAAPSLE